MATKRVPKAQAKTVKPQPKTAKPAKTAKPPTHPVKLIIDEAQAERVRKMCLAFPDTYEKLSHGEPTFFCPQGVFASLSNNHHGDGHIGLWIPAAPGEQEALIKHSPRIYYRPPYVGVAGWVSIELPKIEDEELAVHIHEAWRIITAKKTRAKPKRA